MIDTLIYVFGSSITSIPGSVIQTRLRLTSDYSDAMSVLELRDH